MKKSKMTATERELARICTPKSRRCLDYEGPTPEKTAIGCGLCRNYEHCPKTD